MINHTPVLVPFDILKTLYKALKKSFLHMLFSVLVDIIILHK